MDPVIDFIVVDFPAPLGPSRAKISPWETEKEISFNDLRQAVNDNFKNDKILALIEDNVVFRNLGLAIIDEQHRFGVAQRNALAEKGEGVDTLVMSATPIPRTLSLIFYGDLDITTITDKPKARQEIATSIIPESKYDDMLEYVRRETEGGKQAYFVCSKIEDDEEVYESIEDLWPDYPTKDDFFFDEEEY